MRSEELEQYLMDIRKMKIERDSNFGSIMVNIRTDTSDSDDDVTDNEEYKSIDINAQYSMR
jgi:hypothetical protein